MLGQYGEHFGSPRFKVSLNGATISEVSVIKGAPCGATWEAAEKMKGLPKEDAVIKMGLISQMFCVADPSGWDPISGRSPVHIAGELHSSALKMAMQSPGSQEDEGQGTEDGGSARSCRASS